MIMDPMTRISSSWQLFVIFLLIHSSLIHLMASCPSGWSAFNQEKCIKYLPVNVHFSEADSMCTSHNSSMISIHSLEEQDFILSIGRQHYTLSGVHWIWLGATRPSSDSKDFSWRDGTAFNFTNWRDGCPDNRKNENCVLMTIFRDRPSHWCNFKCESNYDHVVCQRPFTNDTSNETTTAVTPSFIPVYPMTPRPSRFRTLPPFRRPIETPTVIRRPVTPIFSIQLESSECDFGWDFKNNKCYKFVPENVTGEEARYYCKRYGEHSNALMITSEQEQVWAVEFAFYKNDAKDAVWLGAVRTGPEPFNITWRDGRDMNYTNWSPHEPDNRNNSENCVAMNDMAKFFGRWLDAPCSLKFHLICEKKAKIPIREQSFNASSWNSLFAPVTVLPGPESDSRIDPGQSGDPDAVVAKSPPAESSSASVSILIFLVVLLTVSTAFLGYLTMKQRKQMKNNLRESRVNIYYASSSSNYEPEYEEPKYLSSDNSTTGSSHAYATTTSSIYEDPLRGAPARV